MRNYIVHLLKRNYLEKEIPLPGFDLRIWEKRMLVRVDPRHTAIVLEQVPNIGYCIDNIRGVFRKINDVVSPPPLVRLGMRSYWIQESKLDFKALVAAYKQIIYKPNGFIEESIDVSASFVLKDGEYTATIAFGPMELSQLKGMFIFEPDRLPRVVSFLEIDYYLLMEKNRSA